MIKVGISVRSGLLLHINPVGKFFTVAQPFSTLLFTQTVLNYKLKKSVMGNQTERINNDNHPHNNWKPNFSIATHWMTTHIFRLNLKLLQVYFCVCLHSFFSGVKWISEIRLQNVLHLSHFFH